jgi:hypothetical protein
MWRRWVASFIEGGHVGLKINDSVIKNFKQKRVSDKVILYHQSFLI